MMRSIVAAAVLIAPLLSCSPSHDYGPNAIWATDARVAYGCTSLDEIRDVEARVSAFRTRRDKSSVTYDGAREMIVGGAINNGVFGQGSCIKLEVGELMSLIYAAEKPPGVRVNHFWLASRGDGSRVWLHTESYSLSP